MMNIQSAKIDIVQKILTIETGSIIEKINKILDKEMIVAYTVDRNPLTKNAYNKRLQKLKPKLNPMITLHRKD